MSLEGSSCLPVVVNGRAILCLLIKTFSQVSLVSHKKLSSMFLLKASQTQLLILVNCWKYFDYSSRFERVSEPTKWRTFVCDDKRESFNWIIGLAPQWNHAVVLLMESEMFCNYNQFSLLLLMSYSSLDLSRLKIKFFKFFISLISNRQWSQQWGHITTGKNYYSQIIFLEVMWRVKKKTKNSF